MTGDSDYAYSTETPAEGNNGRDTSRQGGGCFVSTFAGFVLLLLSLTIAVGVGIIVHFAGSRELVCKCGLAGEGGTIVTDPFVGHTSGDTNVFTTTVIMMTDESLISYRLPATIKPHHYNLELKPNVYDGNPDDFKFEGTVLIEIEAMEVTDTITLHADRLDIDNSTIGIRTKDSSVTAPKVVVVTYETLRHFYTLRLDRTLAAGQRYYVIMTFSGPLKQDGAGLYYSVYEDNGEKVYLASTHFEAPKARKAFPCFDEPALKATFNITLVRKNSGKRQYRSLSNTEIITSEKRENGYTADVYATTPKMSTYLLSFIVCDFLFMENITTNNVKYRTFARPNAIQYAETAQRYGVKVYEKLEDYFDPNYVMKKLDNIAIPEFRPGAMENWGLVAYKESLLITPGESTAFEVLWVARIIAHELAHQWFGNLVSPKWWGWLWLNEAFASFWDYHIVGELEPSWRMLDLFIASGMHSALESDSSPTSHPVTSDIRTTSQMNTNFDSIAYSKGSSVVRMMHLVMGQDHFVKGLNRYLTKYQYGVAEHHNLWDSLTEEVIAQGRSFNMTKLMDHWVTQMNYPVVTVTRTQDHQITLRQERFLIGLKEDSGKDRGLYDYKWTIPITYTSSVSPRFDETYKYETLDWMSGDGAPLTIKNPTSLPASSDVDSWVIVNIKQCGFFRVNYDTANWNSLRKQLERDHTAIHPINRGQIINDAWNLAKAGQLTYISALNMMQYLRKETDSIPWRAFLRQHGYVEAMLERTDIFGLYQMFVLKSVESPLQSLGVVILDNMSPTDVYARTQLVDLACNYESKNVVAIAVQQFNRWMNNNATNPINANYRSSFYCTAVRNGGWTEWQFAYNKFRQVKSSNEKKKLRRAMSCSKEPFLLKKLLDMSLDINEISPADTRSTIQYVAKNRWGRDITWRFLKERFSDLSEMSPSYLGRLITTVTTNFNTQSEKNEIEDFMTSVVNITNVESAFEDALKKTEANIKWMQDNYATFQHWLSTQTG